MKKRESKIARAAHIKSNTHGTSNEISFSVLDAAKQSLDGGKSPSSDKLPSLGFIPVFTLGLRKKPPATPVKEQGLMLPSGEFISTEGGSSAAPLLSSVTSSGSSLPQGEGVSAESAHSATSATVSSISGDSSSTLGALGSSGKTSSSAAGAAMLGSSSGGWTTPVDEVAKRKSTRKRRKAFVGFLLAAACIAVVAGVGLTLYGSYQAQQTVRGQLIGYINAIEKADAAVLELDEIVVSCINDGWENLSQESGSAYRQLKAELEESSVVLAVAADGIEALQPSLEDPYDQEAAVQAIVAVETRLGMIEAGSSIVEQALNAQNALSHAEEAWVNLVEADSLAREAAQLASDTSKETVRSSMEKSKSAMDAFSRALPCLAAAEGQMEGLDYSQYEEYVELRTKSIEHALLSDQAYLDRNKEKAAAENDEYNRLDAEAAALAQEIGAEPAEMAIALIEPSIEVEMDRYADERAHASAADTSLREYLTS